MEIPRYPYVAVDVPESESEEAGALLFELGAAGVEQRDATTLARGASGLVTLVASFETHDEARAAVSELPPATRGSSTSSRSASAPASSCARPGAR